MPPQKALTVVYTDGACSGNPGPGGWAWVEPDGAFAAGFVTHTTNQRMEITAAAQAVYVHPGPLEVRSDSTYVVNCFRDRWWEGWLRRGWVNSQRKPVANRDLWEPFVEAVRARGDVRFVWVKGHGDDVWNDIADRLAVQAMRERVLLSGDRPPGRLGPPDEPGAGPAPGPAPAGVPPADPEAIEGHSVAVVGHGPELGEHAPEVRDRLTRYLREQASEFDDLVVVTGLRRGAEQLAAEAAARTGLPYVVVLPFPAPEEAWPEDDRRRFASLRDAAREVRTLDARSPASPGAVSAALRRRDVWLARHVSAALVVWDGADPRLGRLYQTFVDHLGDAVLPLDPFRPPVVR
jgi:ribonuclease HI